MFYMRNYLQSYIRSQPCSFFQTFSFPSYLLNRQVLLLILLVPFKSIRVSQHFEVGHLMEHRLDCPPFKRVHKAIRQILSSLVILLLGVAHRKGIPIIEKVSAEKDITAIYISIDAPSDEVKLQI